MTTNTAIIMVIKTSIGTITGISTDTITITNTTTNTSTDISTITATNMGTIIITDISTKTGTIISTATNMTIRQIIGTNTAIIIKQSIGTGINTVTIISMAMNTMVGIMDISIMDITEVGIKKDGDMAMMDGENIQFILFQQKTQLIKQNSLPILATQILSQRLLMQSALIFLVQLKPIQPNLRLSEF